MAKSVPTFNGEAKVVRSFQTIETACLCIGRPLATAIADRHTRLIETHKIGRGAPLYGLKPTTRLRAR